MKYVAWMNSANSYSEEFGVTLLVKKLELGQKKQKKNDFCRSQKAREFLEQIILLILAHKISANFL